VKLTKRKRREKQTTTEDEEKGKKKGGVTQKMMPLRGGIGGREKKICEGEGGIKPRLKGYKRGGEG